jgi:hypothetical protein
MRLNVVAGSPVVEINYGGTLISTAAVIDSGIGNSDGVYAVVMGGNLSATNSQSWDTFATNYLATTTIGNGNHKTSAVDSTILQNLTVTYQGGASSDSITFYRVIVEFL